MNFKIGLLLIYMSTTLNLYSQAHHFSIKQFTIDDGFEQSYVSSVVQDNIGYLWIGTENGLVKYDGQEFLTYTTRDGLADNFITAIILDRLGNIWIGHNKGEITKYNGRTFKNIEGLINNFRINYLFEDKNGVIWAGTHGNGIIRIDQKKRIKIFEDDHFLSLINVISQDYYGNFIIGTNKGLCKYRFSKRNEELIFVSEIEQLSGYSIQSIKEKKEGREFLIGTKENGIYSYNSVTSDIKTKIIKLFDGNSIIDFNNINYIYQNQNQYWLSVYGNGFELVDELCTEIYTMNIDGSTHFPFNYIRCIYRDREGNTWIGTYGEGLILMIETKFVRYDHESGLIDDNITAILFDHNKDLWCGTINGITKIHFNNVSNEDEYTYFTTEEGLPENHITSLYEDSNGNMWIGTAMSGLCKFNNQTKKFSTVEISNSALCNMVNTIYGDEHGNIWIGTKEGVFYYNPQKDSIKHFTTMDGLLHNNVQALYYGPNNVLWLATQGFGIMEFDGTTFQPRQPDEIVGMTGINCITLDKSNNLWFGTNGQGIYKFDGKQYTHYSIESGLATNYIYSIITDDLNQIWLGHRVGVSKYDQKTQTFKFFGKNEGYNGGRVNMNSFCKNDKGHIWFGTDNGAIKYVPAENELENIQEPSIIITALTINNKPFSLAKKLELPSRKYNIEFEFKGVSLKEPEKVRYKYMLEGFDIGWSEVVAANKKIYPRLTEGEYTFKVIAMNSDGVWNSTPATFQFMIETPFWKTTWFPVALSLFIIALIIIVLKLRTRSLEKQRKQLKSEVEKRTKELNEKNTELEKKTNEISLMFESLPVITYLSTTDENHENNQFTYISKSIKKNAGYEPENLINNFSFWEERIYDEDVSMVTAKLFKLYMKGYTEFDFRWKIANGQYKWYRNISRIIKFDDGSIRQVGLWHDITEYKKAEGAIVQMNSELEKRVNNRTKELRKSNKQLSEEIKEHIKTTGLLKQTNKELDTYVYKATHDLRGPLSSTLGVVNIMLQEISDPVSIKYTKLIKESTERLDSILLDLLEVSTVKHSTLKYSKIDFKKTINDIYGSMKNKADEHNIDFKFELNSKIDFYSDITILKSILQNLLDNAIKYHRNTIQEPFVNISVNDYEEGVNIIVTDNGYGIQADVLDRIFDMFYRANESSQGTGLGLYIVKTSIDRLGGKINVESKQDHGTTFTISIPNKSVDKSIIKG